MTLLAILSDGFFAAVAAVGFGAVSDPPCWPPWGMPCVSA